MIMFCKRSASLFLFIATLLVFINTFIEQAKAQYQSTLNREEVGFESEGQRELNKVIVPYIRYYGECPGKAYRYKRSWFTSSKFTPRKNRRVIITNITRGLSPEKPPYTNREYYSGRASEGFDVLFGTKHHNRYLAVLNGINDFEYEIKDKKTTIARGFFQAFFTPSQPIETRRDKVEKTKYVREEYQEWDQKKGKYVTKTRYKKTKYMDCP